MSDITYVFNSLLKPYNTHCAIHLHTSSSTTDEFLKEAYRISSHISSLQTQVLSIRRAYLSIATHPRKRARTQQTINHNSAPEQSQYLSPRDRDALDASTSVLLRDLTSQIHQLKNAESVRRATFAKAHASKYKRNFLFAWAGGGSPTGGDDDNGDSEAGKSKEQKSEEGREDTLSAWRDGVLWYLGSKLEAVAAGWRDMVERRIKREMERGRSDLSISISSSPSAGREKNMNGYVSHPGDRPGVMGLLMEQEEAERSKKGSNPTSPANPNSKNQGMNGGIETELSAEQVQLFASENNQILQHYTDTLSRVRTAERSILEISELQTQLVDNLNLQAGQIEQLVTDSERTEENVGGGNKELKRATERRSVARMVFWASMGLCGTLVTWDLIF